MRPPFTDTWPAGPLYGIARNVLREHWRASSGTESAAIDEMRVDPWDGIDDRLDSAARAGTVISAVLPDRSRSERRMSTGGADSDN